MHKPKIIKISALSLFLMSQSVTAGIPTVDVGAIAQAVIQVEHMLTQIEEARNQVEEAKNQLREAKEQTQILTNKNTYKDFAKESVEGLIPQDWQDLYAITGVETDHLNDPVKYNINANTETLAKMEALAAASNEGLYQQSVALEDLLNELNNPNGIKDSADLQNRIALQQAALTLNQSKLDQIHRQHDMQRDAQSMQRAAYERCIKNERANNYKSFSYDAADQACVSN